MDYVQLAGRQAKEIEELKDVVTDFSRRMKAIRLQLVGIGGPLNDNKYHYTNEQLATFLEIVKHVEDF